MALLLNLVKCFLHSVLSYSVCARRNTHVISSVSAPLNATKVALLKCRLWRTWVVGPELVFSIYAFVFVFARDLVIQSVCMIGNPSEPC